MGWRHLDYPNWWAVQQANGLWHVEHGPWHNPTVYRDIQARDGAEAIEKCVGKVVTSFVTAEGQNGLK